MSITQQQAQILERAYAALSAAAFAHPSAADAIGSQCSEAAKELRQYIEQGAAPGADVVMVPREPDESDIAEALTEASSGVIWDEDCDSGFPREFAMAFYNAMLRAVQHPQQEQSKRHPGCTAGTDEECTVRRCGDVCTERQQESK